MTRATNAAGKPLSADDYDELPDGKKVRREKALKVGQHLSDRDRRNSGETPETAKHSLVDEREGGAKQLKNTSEQSLEELQERAAPVLAMDDPLKRLEESIRAIGFGGRTKHVIIPYLAATSRVEAMERGNLPVHTGLHGTTSSGKTFALDTTLDHFPPDAIYKVDAGSPKILIYDKTDLRHKVIVFSEADSIPGRGEDDEPNPAGAAFRALLQDHHIHYKFVDMRAQGGPKVIHIVREGPSVLLTTYTKRLPDQIDSRLFTVDVPEDMEQIRAALAAQGSCRGHRPGQAR